MGPIVAILEDMLATGPGSRNIKQTTNTVLMVAPTEFRANPEACADNYFADADAEFEKGAVLQEAEGLRSALVAAGVHVVSVDPAELPLPPGAPDGCFPNNWLMFEGGKAILCPMKAVSRRKERAMWPHIEAMLGGVWAGEVVDVSSWENEGLCLEGTGSLVLDRISRVAFAALSERTSAIAAERLTELLNYRLVAFEAKDPQGRPIYHTNVLMSIGEKFALLCPEIIAPQTALEVRKLLGADREVIEISWNQVLRYCGNVLELSTSSGGVVAMSRTAYQAFSEDQLDSFRSCGAEPIYADITTIERVAGGSVRCMLAEVF